MKVKMLRDKFGKLSLTVRTEWSKGNRKCTRAGALRQNLHLVAGQSEMVTEKYPNPTEETRWDLREKLGMMTQKEEEIQQSTCFMWQILSSFQVFFLLCIHQRRLCSAAGKNDPQISVTYTHIYTHTDTNAHIQTHSYRDTHTHTHHNLQMFVISEALARAPSGTRSFCDRKKRETTESHLGFSCLHSEVTQVKTLMFHWPEWVTGEQKYSYLTSITAYLHPSVELLRAVLSIFSHLGEASEEQLCAEIECDLTLRSGLEGIFYLDPLAGVSLTRYSTKACAEWD